MPPTRSRKARRLAEKIDDKTQPRLSGARSALLVCALVIAVYANSLSNGFVFDDHTLVDFNPEVNPAIANAIEQRGIEYRPVRTLSYVLDRELGGHRPASYRVGNLVYHAITGCLALATYKQLGFPPAAALLGAAIFVVHPVQTESVAYISGRRDVLSGLFVLLAFSLYLRWHGPGGKWWHAAIASGALVAGMLTKEVAFAVPLLVVAYDLTVSIARQRAITPSRGTAPATFTVLRRQRIIYTLLALLTMASVAYLVVRGLPTTQAWWGGTPVTNFLNVTVLWVRSAWLLVFPLHLLADYSYEAVPVITSVASPVAWATVGVLLALLGVSLWGIHRRPVAVFLLWWIAATLLPSSHVISHHDFFAEHYLYLPLFGFAGVLSLALFRLGRRLRVSRHQVEMIGMLIVLLFGARTVIRNRDWRDDLTLWSVTSTAAPRCARARANYGGALLAQGDVEAAEPEFKASLEIQPSQRSAVSGMIMIHHSKARRDERDALLQQAQHDLPYTNLLSLAEWFLINKEYPLAIRVAQTAAKRPRADERVWIVEGWARARSGQPDRGCQLLERALKRNPRSPDARAGRDFCRQQGRIGEGLLK